VVGSRGRTVDGRSGGRKGGPVAAEFISSNSLWANSNNLVMNSVRSSSCYSTFFSYYSSSS
jgi:hypothetical protein